MNKETPVKRPAEQAPVLAHDTVMRSIFARRPDLSRAALAACAADGDVAGMAAIARQSSPDSASR